MLTHPASLVSAPRPSLWKTVSPACLAPTASVPQGSRGSSHLLGPPLPVLPSFATPTSSPDLGLEGDTRSSIPSQLSAIPAARLPWTWWPGRPGPCSNESCGIRSFSLGIHLVSVSWEPSSNHGNLPCWAWTLLASVRSLSGVWEPVLACRHSQCIRLLSFFSVVPLSQARAL